MNTTTNNRFLQMDAVLARRALIKTRPTATRHDCLSQIILTKNPLIHHGQALWVCIRYVADKAILDTQSWPAYAAQMMECYGRDAHPDPEALTHMILDDVNDVLIAYWMEVIVMCLAKETYRFYTGQDNRAQWQNDSLLRTLAPVNKDLFVFPDHNGNGAQ